MGIDNGGTTIPDRLDAALVALGLVESRAKAQRLIKSGKVMVDGVTATKPAQAIASASDIAIDKGDDYVSRGAYKLVGAFDTFCRSRSDSTAWTSARPPADSATCCCGAARTASSPSTSATDSSTRASQAIRASSR